MKPSPTPETPGAAGEATRHTLYTQRAPWRSSRPCDHCQAEFRPKRRNQRFCTPTCRFDHHNEEKGKADPKTERRLAELERQVADLKEQVAMIRGHLVL